MRYFGCIVVLFFFCVNSIRGQQNLVLNPSFEDVNEAELRCYPYQSYQEFSNAIPYWNSPAGTSDIYYVDFPEHCPFRGTPQPRTGNGMLGFITYVNPLLTNQDPNEFRGGEFLEGQLSNPLMQGHTYRISFYVLLSTAGFNSSSAATNNFGVKFFENQYIEGVNIVPKRNPDANYTNVINDQNWYLVDLMFTPQVANLNYFIIGNFFPASETLIEALNTVPYISYYYVDDVSIQDVTPFFQPLGPFCKGTTFTLPEVSESGYSGTWSPSINNQETTTYTFTPDDPEIVQTTMTIEIDEPHILPVFDIETTRCEGISFVLPTISDNGIEGIWTPEVNTHETTTYTFTPEVGSCGLETTITILINQTQPEFDIPSFICEGGTFVLPEVSDNGIRGGWTPAVNNQYTTTYTFTPVDNACALVVTKKVEVIREDTPVLMSYCNKNELYVEVVHPNVENQFQWQINGKMIDESSPIIQLTKYPSLLHEGQNTITVSVTNTFGCVITNTLEIDNKNLCFIPRGISPQGDGLNDSFDLRSFGGVSLQIFNRYGTKVYDKKNYTNQWHGQTNSSNTLLPSGTYFYQIVTKKKELLSGWVQLVY